jgi:excisionase family DNA binding protein
MQQLLITNVDRLYVSRGQAAAELGVSLPVIDQLLKSGRLEWTRLGVKRIVIKRASLEKLVE